MHCPQPLARLACDHRIFALWVDHQHRARHGQQVQNNLAHAIACPCRGKGQQMCGAIIVQQFSSRDVASDQQAMSMSAPGCQLCAVAERQVKELDRGEIKQHI